MVRFSAMRTMSGFVILLVKLWNITALPFNSLIHRRLYINPNVLP